MHTQESNLALIEDFAREVKNEASCEVPSTCSPYALMLLTVQLTTLTLTVTVFGQMHQEVPISSHNLPSAAGHGNMISSSVPLRAPAVPPWRSFVSALKGRRERVWV